MCDTSNGRSNALDSEKIVRKCSKNNRVCENDGCGKKFTVSWNKRSQPYCSISCANTKKESIENRRIGQLKTFEKNAENNFFKQAQVYLDIVEKNNIL